jgi:S-DNA-T family DNA segregation ATPase FtsK/SpoIIIE
MTASVLFAEPAAARAAEMRGAVMSIFDPVFVGVDAFGNPIFVPIIFRNKLIGGEPGAGKSSLLSNYLAHAALDPNCRLVLIDGKQVELGLWKDVADVFVGPDQERAVRTLERIQAVMDNRYTYLLSLRRRKMDRADPFKVIVVVIDEIAFFSTVAGDKKDQEKFSSRLRDLVARGRAVGVVVIAATQRPSSDIIPTSLRDLFAWRFAGRCTTDSSSDIVLGHGWAGKGWSANTISPTNQGKGLLIAEGGIPKFIKAAYFTDEQCIVVADYAARMRSAWRDAGILAPNPFNP